MKAVDLFAGFGGLTEGATQAGVEVVWAANHWPAAVRTHELNHPEVQHVVQDLNQADWTSLPDFDLLLSAPACQGHSSASQPRRRAYHDAMRSTAMAVVDCADATNPKAIVVENVPSFTRWRLFDWWCDGLRKLGYDLDFRVVMASHHGVPQRRKRLFVIGTRHGVVAPPLPELGAEPAFEPCLEDGLPETVWKRVCDAPSGMQARIARSAARHGRRFLTQSTTDHMGTPLHEPIRTITTAPQHWALVEDDRYRYLTGRELARAQTFPDHYIWPDELTVDEVTQGIGNAVPCELGRQITTVAAHAAAAA